MKISTIDIIADAIIKTYFKFKEPIVINTQLPQIIINSIVKMGYRIEEVELIYDGDGYWAYSNKYSFNENKKVIYFIEGIYYDAELFILIIENINKQLELNNENPIKLVAPSDLNQLIIPLISINNMELESTDEIIEIFDRRYIANENKYN